MTTMNTIQDTDNLERAYRLRIAQRREHLAAHIDEETLAYLEAEFETNLPCYQTRDPATGQRIAPDPIAAALRDGQREVVLWLRHEIAQYRNNKQPTTEQEE